MRSRMAFAVLSMFLAIAPGAPAAHAKKKARARAQPVSMQEAVMRVLDGRGDAIQECVMKDAIAKGATKVDVSVHLLINNHGQIFGCETTATLDKGDGAPLKVCAEQALRAVAWPKSKAPLISVDRAWHFTSQ